MNVAEIQLWSEPFSARVYAGAVVIAALTVPLLAGALAARRGLPLGRVAICLSVAMVAMLAGSRLLHWWTHPSSQGPDGSRVLAFDFRDFSLYGGLVLAGLAGAVCCGLARVKLWKLADCVAPALGIGIAITRWGCFANGCCFGVETDLTWGVVYPKGSPAHLHQIAGDAMAMFRDCGAVHPTQVYEMLAAGVAALLAFVLWQRNLPSGVPFLAAAIVFTAFRWINEPLRAHASTLVTTGWSYRLLYAVLVVIGFVVMVCRLSRCAIERRTLNTQKLWRLAVLVAGTLVPAERLLAVEIQGTVVEARAPTATVKLDGELFPSLGDKVEIVLEIPGLDDVARVASGTVAEVSGDRVVVKIDRTTGKLATGQRARITSERPRTNSPPSPGVALPGTAAQPPQGTPTPDGWPNAEPQGEIERIRTAAWRIRSSNNLKQIAIAMHTYHEVYSHLPSDIAGREGKPLLSWRVAILPYLEQEDLYRRFKLDEPWDSQHNQRLLAPMPEVYAGPGARTPTAGATFYQRFTGPAALFEGNQQRRLLDIRDGLSLTLIAAEAGEPVPWTKPGDLAYDAAKPLPRLGGLFPDGFHAACADASVYYLRKALPDKTLRALITRDGRETIPDEALTSLEPTPEAKGSGALGLDSPPASAQPPDGSTTSRITGRVYTIRVRADQAWTATGVKFAEGMEVEISSAGTVEAAPAGDDRPYYHQVPPAGRTERVGHLPEPTLPGLALLGKVGNGRAFLVGAGTRLVMDGSQAAGELLLGINDDVTADNIGEWTVRIAVRKAHVPGR